jgi:multidrug efflux system membrane fusion protein
MRRLTAYLGNRPWIIAAALGLAVVAWMASGHRPVAETPGPMARTERNEAPLQQVQVRLQQAEAVYRDVTLYGRTAPARSVELKAETRGRVTAIGAERGEQVAAGEMLVRLDARDRDARLAEARATVYQREIEYEAQKPLLEQGYITEGQLAAGAANLERARAELRRAELDLQYMTVRAPFDGAVQDRMVEVGDYLDVGDPVATFVDDRTLIVTASVAEQDVAAVRDQPTAEARLITGERVEGRIRYIAPVAERSTRTFTIELELDNRDGRLPAGVTAELQVRAGEVLAHKMSPAVLTLNDEGVLGVKIVDAADEVVFHPADIVRSSSDGVWVAGLPERASIITVGQGFVRAGERVAAVPDQLDDGIRTAETGAEEDTE